MVSEEIILFALQREIMAIPIKSIPTLKDKEAAAFVKKTEEATVNRGAIDFTKQIKDAQAILAKAKLR